MSGPVTATGLRVDLRSGGPVVDGWGVNINSKDWNGGKLAPVTERLVNDLGCTMFRQDIYGNSNFIDPDGGIGKAALGSRNLARVYAGKDFVNGKGLARWLNGRGIEPYLTLSGIVPKWMCARDGKTLADTGSFAEMAASFVAWAKRDAGIRFNLFGPMNETDIGPVEGPAATPAVYVKACEALVKALDRRGLRDVKLVVAEQARHDLTFIRAFLAKPALMRRVAAFGMHNYGNGRMADAVDLVRRSRWKDVKVWMTEYGDLEQTGEREWPVAWDIFRRLLDAIDDGYTAALNWDAFDNWHDHDMSWSIYGLIRRGIRTDTPKKRYWAVRHVYRFVRPGWTRLTVDAELPGVRAVAFLAPGGKDLTVAGMNDTGRDLALNITAESGKELDRLPATAALYRTTADDDGVRTGRAPLRSGTWPRSGLDVVVPADSIFTATTLG